MDSQSQGSTINSFSVTASALATYPPNQSILATAAGSATWTDASQGQVTFTNVGWTSVNANGSADLSGDTGWKYSFISNVTGFFVVDYTVTAQGTSSNNPPLFGLNGFFIYGGPGQSSLGNVFDTTGLNASGYFALAIAPASSYWVQIQDSANIFGALGTSNADMNGTFNFGFQTESGSNGGPSVPEPSSWIMMMIGLGFAGYAIARRRVRSAH
ncbi:MAG: PEP-CTERM sorting domain-containing protein [Isosphaerales bacterium]